MLLKKTKTPLLTLFAAILVATCSQTIASQNSNFTPSQEKFTHSKIIIDVNNPWLNIKKKVNGDEILLNIQEEFVDFYLKIIDVSKYNPSKALKHFEITSLGFLPFVDNSNNVFYKKVSDEKRKTYESYYEYYPNNIVTKTPGRPPSTSEYKTFYKQLCILENSPINKHLQKVIVSLN
ncbi:hypothetical protein KAH94_04165 [bacterium]|nr:hypothetical protein [bacterium]